MGILLDVYDDGGRLLVGLADQIPENVKTAAFLPREEVESLPEDLFALVLLDGKQRLKKYACADAASTELSTLYLLSNYRNLPVEAVKVAARNLGEARSLYGMPEASELTKLAEKGGAPEPHGLGNVAEPQTGPKSTGVMVVGFERPGQKFVLSEDIKKREPTPELKPGESADDANRLIDVFRAYIEGKRVGRASTIKKEGDLTGTEVMPVGSKPLESKTVKKLAGAGNVVRLGAPTVAQLFMEKKATRSIAGLPLDTLADAQEAQRWFMSKLAYIPFDARPDLAQHILERREELQLPSEDALRKYGSDHYRPRDEMAGAICERRNLGVFVGQPADYSELVDYSIRHSARQYAEKLAELDRRQGFDVYWGNRIEDPWTATLASEKVADIVYSHGDVFVSDKHIELLAKNEREALEKILDDDVVEEFCKNPVTVYKSLPEPMKKVLGRLAMDRQWRGEVRPM